MDLIGNSRRAYKNDEKNLRGVIRYTNKSEQSPLIQKDIQVILCEVKHLSNRRNRN